ncbi:TPA: hypothetical protein QDZ66_002106 [Pluralibacter gergoviae]|uniref:hypothetical protein n=1 Tax=Pluralibacter gergoviae TaxID=61647 RepID=UPI00069DF2A7|nr:hypothetical protein [Pluralibacter gergoviae]MBL3694555.1 hypothetical protein [Pluralibacter gergoviae]HDS1151352.1 hypothetical protein [Pluralibacter gergoviae]
MDYLDIVKVAINPTGALIDLAFQKAMDTFSSSTSDKEVSSQELTEEAVKANIKSAVLTEQAKVEQEISIAKRILIAEEVEIEEFYDVSGAGHAGVKTDGSNLSFGLQGEGKKVTKRVIKFKGFNSEAITLLSSASTAEMAVPQEEKKDKT